MPGQDEFNVGEAIIGHEVCEMYWEQLTAEIPLSYIDREDRLDSQFWAQVYDETLAFVPQVARPKPHRPVR